MSEQTSSSVLIMLSFWLLWIIQSEMSVGNVGLNGGRVSWSGERERQLGVIDAKMVLKMVGFG